MAVACGKRQRGYLSPSRHKYGDVLVPSGLGAERTQSARGHTRNRHRVASECPYNGRHDGVSGSPVRVAAGRPRPVRHAARGHFGQVVRVPFRILTKEEDALLDKNYEDIKKQMDGAVK